MKAIEGHYKLIMMMHRVILLISSCNIEALLIRPHFGIIYHGNMDIDSIHTH